MPDFETMPVGTRRAIRETAELLRSYERHHMAIAKQTGAKTGREEKAERNRVAAERLEALLELGAFDGPVSGDIFQTKGATIPTFHIQFRNGSSIEFRGDEPLHSFCDSGVPGDGLPLEGV